MGHNNVMEISISYVPDVLVQDRWVKQFNSELTMYHIDMKVMSHEHADISYRGYPAKRALSAMCKHGK